MTREGIRLEESKTGRVDWKQWGPYLSERAWGTVREDYSADGTAWEYFPHDHARSRAYRWSEDGLAGICDRHQLSASRSRCGTASDPILKERLFGLTGNEGRHGEDVKEYYFYLDSTPTHSYMKYLYKYPQAAFPYAALIDGNRRREPHGAGIRTAGYRRIRRGPLLRCLRGICQSDAGRYSHSNHGGQSRCGGGQLDLLPTVWFRNTWSWGLDARRPRLAGDATGGCTHAIRVSHFDMAERWLLCEGKPEFLFTDNETNFERLFGVRKPHAVT